MAEEEVVEGRDGEGVDEVDAVPPNDASAGDAVSRLRSRGRVPHRPSRVKGRAGARPRYYPWAELLHRVFEIEVFTCPWCGGARRLLAAIHDPDAIERVLRAMGLPTEVPELRPARAPPEGGEVFWGA